MSVKHGQEDDDDDSAANERQEHRLHFLFDENIRNVLLGSSADETSTTTASASSEVRPWTSSSTVGDREEAAAESDGRFEAGRRRENRPPYLWSGQSGRLDGGRRPKSEIPFTFRHCVEGEDTSHYIQQYRNDYTYANAAWRQQSVGIGDFPTETTTTTTTMTTASHRQTDRSRPPPVAMGDREKVDACCSSTRHSAPAAVNCVQQQKTTGDNSPRAKTTTGNCQQPSSGVNGIRALISPRRVLLPLVVISGALFDRARDNGAVVAVEGRRMEFADGPSIARGKTAKHFPADGYVLNQQTA